MAVVKTFGFLKNRNIVGICFHFSLKCGIWDCCRLLTASDYDFSCAPAKVPFTSSK